MSRSASAAALVVAIVAGLVCVPAAHSAGEIGRAAPALIVEELNGSTFDLSALRGRVVVVNFWASWCPPCRREMPALDAVYRRYHSQGLEMIGLVVAGGRARDRADAREAMESLSYPAAMVRDAKVNGFGAPDALPITYVVDRDGFVRARLTPDKAPLTESGLVDLVVPLLPQAVAK